MANNRLYLICTTCRKNGPRDIRDSAVFMVAKYYPSTGWFPYKDEWAAKLEKWLAAHSHETQWGANIVSELEIAKDEETVNS
jgi:hypothetical protein